MHVNDLKNRIAVCLSEGNLEIIRNAHQLEQETLQEMSGMLNLYNVYFIMTSNQKGASPMEYRLHMQATFTHFEGFKEENKQHGPRHMARRSLKKSTF